MAGSVSALGVEGLPKPTPNLLSTEPRDMTIEVDEAFDWETLVPRIIHPLKVVIIEALQWIGKPLSASDLTKLIDDKKIGLSHVSYHVVTLSNVGAIKVVRKRQVRGSIEKFYFFP